eukprot:TRINITY_DN12943_c0_g1_i4.p2 TRINITY_DN12943_c0_g1~~TRINITY_DN12943_c0_g1_i4.p2  ORF type:complete len:194 (-),score=-1.44 TRINITY_DN12943_c0_g1_i4:35-616(-)
MTISQTTELLAHPSNRFVGPWSVDRPRSVLLLQVLFMKIECLLKNCMVKSTQVLFQFDFSSNVCYFGFNFWREHLKVDVLQYQCYILTYLRGLTTQLEFIILQKIRFWFVQFKIMYDVWLFVEFRLYILCDILLVGKNGCILINGFCEYVRPFLAPKFKVQMFSQLTSIVFVSCIVPGFGEFSLKFAALEYVI